MRIRFVSRPMPIILATLAALVAVLMSAPASWAANVALGKPAFASYNSGSAGNVTDGNGSTSWNNNGSSLAPADFIAVDLGAPTSIKYVRAFWAGGQPVAFSIEVAQNVVTDPGSVDYGSGDWINVYSRSSFDPQPGNPDLIDLTKDSGGNPQSLSYRYIRIYGQDGPVGSTNWGLSEFQVLDAPLVTLSGTARYQGAPVAGAIVYMAGPIASPGAPPARTVTATTDASGAFSIAGLEAGAYNLTARAPGKYAPMSLPITVASTDLTQNVDFTATVINTTAALPAYNLDFIATPANKKDGNASSNGLVLPSDELPAGDTIWNTATPLPLGTGDGAGPGGEVGPDMPKTLNFYFPPTADGKNNVLSIPGSSLVFPKAHYAALYILQVATDRDPSEFTATLHYGDGSTEEVRTTSGSNSYRVNTGVVTPSEDEVVAFSVDKRYAVTGSGSTVPQSPSFNVFMRTIPVDPSKTLSSLAFGLSNISGTIQIPVILAWSGDALDQPEALGSISGTVKGPAATGGNPVASATVSVLSYRVTTDAAGHYSFSSLPAGTYTVSAGKPANYATLSVDVPLAAGEAKVQDIQFPSAIPVLTGGLTGPTVDMISNDSSYNDFGATGAVLGSEYMPAGIFSPDTVPNPPADPTRHPAPWDNTPNWQADPNAPGALAFDFGDPTLQSVAVPGDANYPLGGTPNVIVLHNAQILAPQTNVVNCYMLVLSVQGVSNFVPTLHYTDGTSETTTLNFSDWYGTPTATELPYLIMHGRHSVSGENDNGTANDPTKPPANIRIKVVTIKANKDKVLHDITFDHGDQKNRFPIVLAMSWETVTPQPATSDLRVTVKQSDGSAAAGAWVVLGPYSVKADANGVAILRGVFTNLPVEIGAFLSGVTQQKRETFTVPAGQKMPTPHDVTVTLPAAAPIFVQLPLAFDYDNIADRDQPGDFHAQSISGDAAFQSESLPASNTMVTSVNIPFQMPHTETGYMNLLRMNGQTWNINPGHYSALNFIVLGQGVGQVNSTTGVPDPVFHHVTMNYSDGSSEQVQLANTEWTANFKSATVYRGLYYRQVIAPLFQDGKRRKWDSDPGSQIGFVQEMAPINAAKTLVSITTPTMFAQIGDNDFSFLCATLEANDTAQSATITGRVMGRPLGADGNPVAAAVPLGQVQVTTDGAHMAYTNADGTFSLSDVPVSTTKLTIIPLGTGILTSTKAVTLSAGANALGDFNAGTAVTQVYCILGPTNTESGLRQVDGAPIPYAKDSNRPKNFLNIPDSGTSPITIAGKTARAGTYASDYFYFLVDKGWLFRGRQGGNGLDTSTFQIDNNAFVGKVAPKIYMRIEYLDRGTDTFTVNYNRMQGNVNTTFGIPTYNMSDSYRTPQVTNPADATKTVDAFFTKTNTNTWKTADFVFDPAAASIPDGRPEAFGAYQGQNLEADFRINPRNAGTDPAEVIRSVILSTNGSFVLPAQPSAALALRIAGGLATGDQDITVNDVTGATGAPDGKVTISDAIALIRQGQL